MNILDAEQNLSGHSSIKVLERYMRGFVIEREQICCAHSVEQECFTGDTCV